MAIKWFPGKDRKSTYGPDYKSVDAGPKPTYDGAVLSTTKRSVQVMSDIWEYHSFARVWDGEKATEVFYGSDYSGMDADVSIDATDAAKAAAAAYDAAIEAAKDKARREAEVDKRIAYAKRLDVGKDVIVVRGRKVKIGSTGRIFWFGETKYGYRAGLELANGSRVFTAASNIEVSNPDDYLDVPALMAYAA